ncbi:MFS transporter [Microbacterium pseudoresistens]|uniref:Putative MFS family arabinose efflux permease n=1 Tax=Microbacterium pseudoresistens TaxID=640634 RepID=A0A7Y9JLX8_9MICO|nr:MFS transporter [Microbacterium pseudoresistens]NYD54187.1 putative MFS family arabinose efflux permease [Microbacterium pseudoresistens]
MTTTAPLPVAMTTRTPRLPYGALIAMMTMSFLLVTAEFLPNGLLTDISTALRVTPGQAGQMVTVTALAGLIAAPTVGLVFPRLDRRRLLVGLALAAAVSNVVVAIAPNLPLVLVSRLLLGAAISGFWAMSITVAARIAGQERLGRAVMFTSAGASLATVAGVPLGVMLGELLDWRTVFALAAAASLLLAIALRALLPSVPADGAARLSTLVEAARRPGIALGLAGHVLVVFGHFLAYTYIRLALDRVQADGAPIDAGTVILLLSVFGAGGFIGNIAIGLVIDRTYRMLAVATPLVIAVATLGVILGAASPWTVAAVAFVWGFFFSSWILIVNTWVGHRMPDRLEAGGSIVVVGFQGAIMLAAGLGGLLIDGLGVEAVYATGAVALVAGAALFGLSNRASAKRGS